MTIISNYIENIMKEKLCVYVCVCVCVCVCVYVCIVGIEPLKVRHDVTKLDLAISLLSL